MASSNSNTTTTTTTTTNLHSPPPYGSDPTTPNTTFVQANPSNFREVVQKLTGASEDPSAQKLPLTLPSRLAAQQAHHHRLPTTTTTTTTDNNTIGPKKPNFKLHERRAKKLELNNIGVSETPTIFINNNNNNIMMMMMSNMNMSSPSLSYIRNNRGIMASPVSPLDHVLARGSPRTPKSPYQNEEEKVEEEEEEERVVIAEKGFYLHPSPRASQPPELLPLFPLHSPSSHNSSSPPS